MYRCNECKSKFGQVYESNDVEVEELISGASDEELDIAIARADVLLELQPKIDELKKENQELKRKINVYENPNDLTLMFMYCDEIAKDTIKELEKQLQIKEDGFKATTEELCEYAEENEELKKQIEEKETQFIEYLESEKDRLAQGCSHAYEDNLGKILYVNEDIYNEVNKILSKYKEIIGGKE